jgi:hypothetical protein
MVVVNACELFLKGFCRCFIVVFYTLEEVCMMSLYFVILLSYMDYNDDEGDTNGSILPC